MSKVLIPLAKGFEEIEAVSIIDVLRRAQIEVVVSALNENLLVLGANGITLQAQNEIKEINENEFDMIVLPGGAEGTQNLADNKDVQNLLKEFNLKGKNIGAICAAPYALHTAGVLKQNYTCYPSFEKNIKEEGFQGDKFMVVEDENIITSRGPGTAICFALEIVKKLKGVEVYQNVKDGLLASYCK
jgi:4-methyl-5(b-hydroxyethyl)-thiazole monophosphate biosynthesis